jgi:Flp pilus assembly CpaE family ATPase
VGSDYRAVTQAADQGRTLDAVCPRKKINRDFNALASRVCGVSPTTRRHALIKALTGSGKPTVRQPNGFRTHETQ